MPGDEARALNNEMTDDKGSVWGTQFGGARLPNDLTILTKVLTLVSPTAALDRWACRAADLPWR
jgi:hypothetical protein